MDLSLFLLLIFCCLSATCSQNEGGDKRGRRIHSSISDIVSKATSKLDKNKNILSKTPPKMDVIKPGW
jgi:hypothetical protein